MDRQRVGESPCFWIDEGRSAIEIPTAIKLVAAATQEWRAELGLVVCPMDVKHAFDNVSPESLSLIMEEMETAPMLAVAIFEGTDWRNI